MSSSRTAPQTTPTLTPSAKYPTVKFAIRPSQERGHADHGWLKTFHTFSFASYYDSQMAGHGALRVINEDRVDPSEGFGRHRHSEMEIFSYIVSGEIEHQDSMGNKEIMKRGDVQMTSAGKGIAHSEYNRNTTKTAHFLQIWVNPQTRGLTPKYFTRHFTDAEKKNQLVKIVSPIGTEGVVEEREGSGPTPIHAQVSAFASILSPSSTVTHTFPSSEDSTQVRKAYIHVIQISGYNTRKSSASGARVKLNDELELGEGDGAFISGLPGDRLDVENVGNGDAEFVLFDIE